MEGSFAKIKNSFKRHLFTKDVRGASVLISFLAVATKPVGFIKNLIVAWLFGASIFMDGFNMAVEILAFLVGFAPNALENAIFPALARARAGGENEDRRLMVWTFWSVGLASLGPDIPGSPLGRSSLDLGK